MPIFPSPGTSVRIEGKIVRNWNPRQLGFGKRAVVSCTVHFAIGAQRGRHPGDPGPQQRRRASSTAKPCARCRPRKLPPLPPQYTGQSLGVTFIFNLEPGHVSHTMSI